MYSKILVETKSVGRKKRLVPDWSLPVPPEWQRKDRGITLRDLITRVVLAEVEGFKDRQEKRRFIRVLTEGQIEDGIKKGKIDPGKRDLDQKVDSESAVATALLAFEDGLYYVFIDGQQYHELDEEVFVGVNSRVTFLRLVPLVGG